MTKPFRITCILSGGQTGADQGGLFAAQELGIPTGGTAPQGWLTETGAQASLLQSFGLSECEVPGNAARTRQNVLNADGTLLIGPYRSGGSALTAKLAKEMGKPLFHIAFAVGSIISPNGDRIDEFRYWLQRYEIHVLNVAGNRETQSPGIQTFTRVFLRAALAG